MKQSEIIASIKREIKRVLAYRVTMILKARGVSVGKDLRARSLPHVRMSAGSAISIGEHCTIHNSTSQNVAGILHRTILATLSPGTYIRIGNNVGISGATLVSASAITIEDDVLLGANVKIFDSDFHPLQYVDRMRDNHQSVRRSPVRVRKGAWIGADVIVLKGVDIGERAVIGAGSIVTKSVPPDTIYAGNPARFVRALIAN